MKKTITTGLALLLLAGAGSEALAQNRERGERGDRGGGREQGVERPARNEGGRWGRGPGQPPSAPVAQRAPEAQAPAQVQDRSRWDGRSDAGRQRWADRDQRDRVQGDGDSTRRWDRDRQRGTGDRNDRRWDNNDRRGDNVDRRWDGDRQRGAYDRNDRRWDNDRRGDNRRWDGDRRDGRQHYDRYRPSRPVYQSARRYRGHAWRAPSGFYLRSWGYGDILPRGWYGSEYRILNWWSYGLPSPPPGYDWVRVGPDAILVDGFSGEVVEVVRLVFW